MRIFGIILFIIVQPSSQEELSSKQIMDRVAELIDSKLSALLQSCLPDVDVQHHPSNQEVMMKLSNLDIKLSSMQTLPKMISDISGSQFQLMSDMSNRLEGVEAKNEAIVGTLTDLDIKLTDIEDKQELRHLAIKGPLTYLDQMISDLNESFKDNTKTNASNDAIMETLQHLELKLTDHKSQVEDILEGKLRCCLYSGK